MSAVARYGIFGVDAGSAHQIMICEVWTSQTGAEQTRSDLKKAGYRKLKIKRLGVL